MADKRLALHDAFVTGPKTRSATQVGDESPEAAWAQQALDALAEHACSLLSLRIKRVRRHDSGEENILALLPQAYRDTKLRLLNSYRIGPPVLHPGRSQGGGIGGPRALARSLSL